MKVTLIFIVLASLLIATSCAEPNPCYEKKKCCDPLPGRDGRDGRNGRDGLDGQRGLSGVNGTDGTDGSNGVQARAEYGEIYNAVAVTILSDNLIPLPLLGGLSAGVAQTTGSSLTVAKSGHYLVTLYLAPSTSDIALSAKVTLRVDSVLLPDPQYSFQASGASRGNTMTAIVHLNAGQKIDFISVGNTLTLPSVAPGPNINLNLMSLRFD